MSDAPEYSCMICERKLGMCDLYVPVTHAEAQPFVVDRICLKCIKRSVLYGRPSDCNSSGDERRQVAS